MTPMQWTASSLQRGIGLWEPPPPPPPPDRRRQVLDCLSGRGWMSTQDIADVVGLTKPALRDWLLRLLAEGAIARRFVTRRKPGAYQEAQWRVV